MKSIFVITKSTKILLLGIFIIISISVAVAYFYYTSKNNAEDPRIVQSKIMFQQFDELLKQSKFAEALPLMDSIEWILDSAPGYRSSFEPGLVYNNRGSAYLSLALYTSKDSIQKTSLLQKAKWNIDTGIIIYKRWIDSHGKMSENEMRQEILPFFDANDPAFKDKNYQSIVDKRMEDLMLAKKEMSRRLSVSFTNLGIIQRHLYQQEDAINSYVLAIRLWKDNYTARNNLNVLMGKAPEDRSIIDQLFPPEKNKF